jgi:hypothetical protein
MTPTFKPVPGYDTLGSILTQAYDQAARTKGAERHADGKPFHLQPMQTIAEKRGIGFLLGQADKKSIEAQGMIARGEVSKGIHELLGAIVYTAGAILFTQRNMSPVAADDASLAKEEAKPEPEPASTPSFKVGDRVRIAEKVDRDKYKTSCVGFNFLMEEHLGQVGVVAELSPNDKSILVRLDDRTGWYWLPEDLTLVQVEEPKPEPEAKGPAVHVIVLDDTDPDVDSIQRMIEGFLRGSFR